MRRTQLDFYRFLRPLMFRLDAEQSHQLTFALLELGYHVPGIPALMRARYQRHVPSLPVDILGLQFPNPIGLAAGLDKDARYLHMLSAFGFGWLELGTVTPRPQAGNPRPRLFRIPRRRALINRMGFNNAGIHAFVENLARYSKPGLIAVNIGKNADTPLERALDDYLYALRQVYIHAAYITVNVSSPNTPGLRQLQENQRLTELLEALKTEQAALTRAHGLYVPLALKVAPDLNDEQIRFISDTVLATGFDAVIATNTTLARPRVSADLLANEAGGLSGRPLKPLATRVIGRLYSHLQGRVPIIGVGGIENASDAWDKLVAGADLLQIYTALIYHGPDIVAQIVRGLAERVARSGHATLASALAAARAERTQPVRVPAASSSR